MDERETGANNSQEDEASEPFESKDGTEHSESTPEGDARNPQEGLSGDALAWLEGPAFRAPIEEMPTLQWSDGHKDSGDAENYLVSAEALHSTRGSEPSEGAPAQEGDELEDAIQWLEQMAEEQGLTIEDTPTLVSSRDTDMAKSAAAVKGLDSLGDTTPLPELDSDPMAWLEQLAIDQDSPLEELPSVADRLLASEIVSQIDPELGDDHIPEPLNSQAVELNEALMYLERQAEAEGVSLDDVSFDQSEPNDSLDEELETIDQLAVAAVPAVTKKSQPDQATDAYESGEWDDLSEQIPEDPDEALVWLGELAEEESSSESDSGGSALAKGAAVAAASKLVRSGDEETPGEELVPLAVDGEQALDTDVLAGMPDDPDEAMAWMEGLAGQDEDGQVDQAAGKAENEAERQTVEFTEDAGPANDEDYALARAALATGAVGTAAKHYRRVLDDGQGGPELVEELETAVSEQPDDLELVQLLGDAYMEQGQLQKALNAYRKGFDHL